MSTHPQIPCCYTASCALVFTCSPLQTVHSPRTQSHAHFFVARGSRACQRSCVYIAAFLVRVIFKKKSPRSHAMFGTLLGPPLTAPSQSTATSSSRLFPSDRTPTVTLLFGGLAERSPLTSYEPDYFAFKEVQSRIYLQ